MSGEQSIGSKEDAERGDVSSSSHSPSSPGHLISLFRRHLCQTSESPMGLLVERARGARVYTQGGREYLDFISGICVANIGHTHPEVVAAVQRQAAEYLHVMVYGEYVLPVQVELAARLAGLAPEPLDTVYFTNSGTEANEG